MAGLTSKTIAATYKGLLKTKGDNVAIPTGSTGIQIVDGEENVTALYLTDGEVGIGVASPEAELHVEGSGTTEILVESTSTSSSKIIFKNTTRTWSILNKNSLSGKLSIDEGSTERLVIADGGNVGIGTTSPGSTLEVAATAAEPTIELSCWSTTESHTPNLVFQKSGHEDIGTLTPTEDDENLGEISFWGVDNSSAIKKAAYIRVSQDSAKDTESVPARMTFATSDTNDNGTPTPRITILEGGKVGIGITVPENRLHVHHDTSDFVAQVENDVGAGHGLKVKAGGHTHASAITAQFGGDNSGTFVPHVTMLARGWVGIGDTSPDAHFKVEDTAIDTDDYTVSDDYWGILANHTVVGADSKEFNNDDRIRGIFSELSFTDGVGGGGFGELTSGRFHCNVVETGLTTSQDASAIIGYAYLEAGAELDSIYGQRLFVDIDGGTVDDQVFGQHIDVNIAGGTQSSDVVGAWIEVSTSVNPSGNVFGHYVRVGGSGVDASDDFFYKYVDSQNGDTVAQVTALAGVATFDSGDFTGAPDYAEYFESKDGNAIAIGSTVKLDGNKIVACSSGDIPIGVVRPKASSGVVCNAATMRYQGKYLKTDYDEVIMEDYTIVQWTEEITLEEFTKSNKDATGGVLGGNVRDERVEGEKTYLREHSYHSDRIPEGMTAPDDAKILTPQHQRKKLNPDYDLSRVYNSRKERDEWCLVGLLGQIPITKGQPVASNWVKMNDVSDSVEMWFVK